MVIVKKIFQDPAISNAQDKQFCIFAEHKKANEMSIELN